MKMLKDFLWEPVRLLFGLLLWGAALCDNCLSPSLPIHITEQNLDKHTVDSSLFYQCYVSDPENQFGFKLNSLQVSNQTQMLIYADSRPYTYTRSCGNCQSVVETTAQPTNNTELVESSDTNCKKCDNSLDVSAGFMEIYLRIPLKCQGDKECVDSQKFSVTIYNKPLHVDSCKNGTYAIIPFKGENCVIETVKDEVINELCIKPTCSNAIIHLNTSNEKYEHIIQPTNDPYKCLWNLNTENGKYIQITFTPEVKSHLAIYEKSLNTPKWDIEWCPDYGNEVVFKTTEDTVFVVFESDVPLLEKNSLTFMAHVDFCSLPPLVEYGEVEFKKLESGTIALYSCNENFIMDGPNKTYCRDKIWEIPPICVPIESTTSEQPIPATDSDDNDNDNDDEDEDEYINNDTIASEIDAFKNESMDFNLTVLYNISQWDLMDFNSTDKGNLFYFFNLKDKHTLYILIGLGGVSAFLVIVIHFCICYRIRHPRVIRQKFNTRQNPIYEKSVSVPLDVDIEADVEHEKAKELEEISDSTILE